MSAKAHILIIDDDANTLASLSRAFRLSGHEVTVCDNAARALDLARARRFDLILSDVVMPGRDGITLLEDFRNGGVASPVVMMSGQATIEMAVRAEATGLSLCGSEEEAGELVAVPRLRGAAGLLRGSDRGP